MSSEWKTYRIEDIAAEMGDAPFGSNLKNDDYCDSGALVVQGKNIQGRVCDWTDRRYVSFEKYTQLKKNQCFSGDLLFPKVGTIGKVGLLTKALDVEHYVLSTNTMKLRVNEKLASTDFVYYYFLWPRTSALINAFNSKSVQPVFNFTALKNFEIKLPSLEKQKHISLILQSFDDRISLLRETNATLEAIAQAIFKSWFVDFDPVHAKQQGRTPEGMDKATATLFPDGFEESELGLVPRGWRVGMVADIGEVICGKTPPTSESANYGDDVPFITIPDMHNLLVITSTNRALSSLGANTQKKKTLPIGSVCVSCIATAGLVARVTTPSQTNQQINSVVPLAKWGKSFPLFTLRRIGDAVRAGGSGGSVFHNLNKSGFEQLKVLFPSEELTLVFKAMCNLRLKFNLD